MFDFPTVIFQAGGRDEEKKKVMYVLVGECKVASIPHPRISPSKV
jgi:hypothetical protein